MTQLVGSTRLGVWGSRRAWISRNRAWVVLAISATAYLIVWIVGPGAPFHTTWGRAFFDLRVYREGSRRALDGVPLYAGGLVNGYGFTYPPAAALAFVPLTVVPLGLAKLATAAVSLGALVATLWLILRLRSGKTEAGWGPFMALGVSVALWTEPVTATLNLGQVNFVIALLIMADLARRDGARTKGAMIGLAAGLKLTPLVFVPYLFFTGRRRAAAVSLGIFAATVGVAFAVLPSDSSKYWSGTFLDTSRVGSVAQPADQSVHGVLFRLFPSVGQTGWWIAVAVVIGAVGLALAVHASRHGDEAIGFSLCALTGLLVSPISWSHHWVLVLPGLFLLAVNAYRRCSRLILAAVGAIVLVTFIDPIDILKDTNVFSVNAGQLVLNIYVWLGLAALAIAGVRAYRAPR